jgi:hypothetical protein
MKAEDRGGNRDDRRWTVISIPGREDDGSDTRWFAYEATTRRSGEPHETAEAAREDARRRNAKLAEETGG